MQTRTPLAARDVVVVGAVRTPVGKRKGALAHWRPDDLLAFALRALMDRAAGVPDTCVEDVIVGCVDQVGEQSLNIARKATLIAGFPIEVTATTVDRQCGSSQQAVHFAANAIRAGEHDVAIAAGIESMTRVPIAGAAHIYGSPVGPAYEARFAWTDQGVASELMAEHYGLDRQALDAFAFESHRRAYAATEAGRFAAEIAPVPIRTAEGADSGAVLATDEGIRPTTSLEKLAALAPAFDASGVTTAGNASQISDGAAAVLLMSAEAAARHGLRPLARVVAHTVSGVDPTMMLHGPIPATHRVLERAGIGLDDVQLFEINEAFATVPVAWLQETGVSPDRLNVNGGAIALGHPLGASGARILTTLVHELERQDARYGVQVMCTFGGMATATVIERLGCS